ncbi:MAG TPA: universal stress protein [Armatimonadota bacterium]|jgi:two-component system sensor histidine kinase KdpD
MAHKKAAKSERMTAENRGKLKIFLGAVPGVGKTYRMLSEAQRRVARGEDIVIGIIETHGRPATAELVQGLEQIPLKRIEYREKNFYEMDTSAVIKRKPEWVLVDELAHTNIPGTVHAKRWQSVEEILDAGINVISTVNVQHVESLNDVIHQITGVRVRETLPDHVIEEATEVELVDLTPDAVINRLRRGDIYNEEKISQALANFFRKGNIVALRELALQVTAEEVDDQLHKYMDAHKMDQGKAAREYVVVAIAPRPLSLKLVRRGYRLAKRTQGDFSCVFVKTPGALISSKEESTLQEINDLARNLGGESITLEGDSVADEIIKYANGFGATMIVLGQSARSRFEEIVRGSTVNKIMRETTDVDIVIIADSAGE